MFTSISLDANSIHSKQDEKEEKKKTEYFEEISLELDKPLIFPPTFDLYWPELKKKIKRSAEGPRCILNYMNI